MADFTQLSDLHQYFVLKLPGIMYHPAVLDQAIVMAFRAFAKKTESWREWIGPFNVVKDLQEYVLEWPFCSSLVRIYEVKINTSDGVSNGLDGVTQDKYLYAFDQPDKLVLADDLKPAADVASALDVKVAMIPKLEVKQLPKWYVNQWVEPIIAHAMWELAGMRKASWYDPQLSEKGRIDYLDGAASAGAENEYGYTDIEDGMEA